MASDGQARPVTLNPDSACSATNCSPWTVRLIESAPLAMNLCPLTLPSPPMGERVAGGRVRGQVHGPNACAKAKEGSS